ncbi:MAG TPA: Ig-like domain-containing protein [Nocardioides sp.]|nr:Ig-like domain-containing protein [Nocardioides sp.]
MTRRWRRTASGTALALVLGTLVVLAYRYDGKPFTEVELNDGGVWVTNQDLGLAARLNPQIEELDLGVDAVTSDFDIFQRATSVYLDDASADRSVKPVDVRRAAALDPTSLPTGAVVAHGGTTFAVVDTLTGKAWVQPSSRMSAFSPKTAAPDLTGALAATVAPDGRAWVLGRNGRATPFDIGEDGRAAAGDPVQLGEDLGTDAAMVALTVVGDTPVLYSRSSLELTRPGADPVVVETTDPSAVELQQPATDGDEVYVATREGLYLTPLGGGDLEKVGDQTPSGAPAAPVVLPSTRCVYAAWASPTPPNYLRDCPGVDDDDDDPITDMQDDAELVFRVNRDVIVLNDVRTGDAWLVQQPGKAKIDNWPQVDPDNENRSKIKKTTDETPDQENRPPEPEDDDFGARPGRSTVLPVVAFNDHDPDGDIIRITKTEQVSGEEVEVKIVGGGTQLQVAVPAGATGTSVFRYYVNDGRVNEPVRAEVRLQIRGDDQHQAPDLMPDRKEEQRLTVVRGATTSYYLLADFFDMDGDDLTLTEATARGGEVEFRPDGTLTYTDGGTGSTTGQIQYTIEDGIDSYQGRLDVQVVGETAPPELVDDLASGVADKRVVVQPLTNDRNPEGGDLTLKNVRVVGDDAGTQISRDLESGTFTFQASKAKSYYLEYSAYNSSATESSFIRLDIESPPKDNRPPVAVRDKATITPGGTAQVDLLLNDLDPDGDVLVVKRINRPSVPGVKVSVVDKRLAVVSSVTDLVAKPVTVEYVVSDGRSSTTGTLVIAQRSSSQGNRHPVANKDQATVRAGSVTSIPVLTNDSDPDGSKPRLFQSDLDNKDELDVWVAGDTLRLRAPEEPGTYSVIYGVRDNEGLRASAEVSIYVVADSAKNNHPPLPQPIIDRVIGGRPKVISVDLVGADPDGDAASFRSVLTAPSLGRVVDTGVDWIRYEAFDEKRGTDFFQILVQDKYGATGVAEVRVGVVPEEKENQRPVALDDNVLVQPNRTISYNVLTNDVDPDDDPLRIASLNPGIPAKHDNGFIEVEVGDAPDSGSAATNIGYTIEDAAGAQDNALLKISASKQAPFYAPIARDDVAELGDIIGKEPGQSVEVPVLDNDLDFDGAKADLEVTDCDAGSRGECEVVDGDSAIRVELKAEDQVVLYRLDDGDDKSTFTFGVVFVTGTDNVPPQLTTNKDRVPVEVTAGETKVFDLQDLVVTRAGRSPSIVPDTLPTAVNGAVTPVEGEPTSLSFVPNRGHVGAASVTVAVSDGRTAAEDAALTSLLTIPIDVKPATNVAPTMRDAEVDVTADGDPAEVDLAGLTKDANEGDLDAMTWSVRTTPPGLTADIGADSSILSIEAGGGAAEDEDLRIEVVADDGNGGQATAVVTVRVVGSNLPLLQIPVIAVNAEEGKETAVDIADYAVNPYPDEPVEATNPRVEGGDGRLTGLRAEGSSVRFTPSSSGSTQVSVTVSDASGDRTRDVVARIDVTVISEPDAPDRPVLSSVEASSAVLSWREPEANGAAITEYQVDGSHGFQQTCSASPTCRLEDLTPGEAYTFTVKARNSEGWSKESPPSEEIIPNKAPDLMAPPTIVIESKPTGERMDRQLTVRWTPPHNEGSEITSYEVKEAGSGRIWPASGKATSLVIPGLTNGTPYAFEIRAVNDVEPRREFSGASKAVAPFGKPMRSGVAPQLTASEDSPYSADPWVRLDWTRWSESQSNGNPVSSYTLYCTGCRQSTYQVDASSSSRTFNGADGIRKGETVTFQIAATNDAGTGDKSPDVSGKPWTKAGPVRNLAIAAPSPADRTARIGWDAPADIGGLPLDYYVVESAETGARTTVSAAPGPGGTNIEFSSNGRHSIRVWAVTRNGDRAVSGQEDSLGGIDTWGKPFPPPGSAPVSNDYYSVDIRLQPGGENGKDVTGVQYSLDGGGSWVDSNRYTGGVRQGGDSTTILARTVSAAEGDRKYSDPVSITGSSKMRWLSASFPLVCIGSCRLQVKGEGFPREPGIPVSTSPGSLGTAGTCDFNQVIPDAKGYFPNGFDAGGKDCSFTGNGTATVTVTGIPATATR